LYENISKLNFSYNKSLNIEGGKRRLEGLRKCFEIQNGFYQMIGWCFQVKKKCEGPKTAIPICSVTKWSSKVACGGQHVTPCKQRVIHYCLIFFLSSWARPVQPRSSAIRPIHADLLRAQPGFLLLSIFMIFSISIFFK